MVKERVLEEAVSSGKGEVDTLGDGAIWIHKHVDDVKIVRANLVAQINRTTTNGP